MRNETFPVAERPPAPRGLRTAGIVAGLIAVAVVVIGILSRQRDTRAAQTWSDAQAIPVVRLVTVSAGASAQSLVLPGTLEAWNAAKIYARVGGYLHAWYKDIGDRVGAGTPLGLIDTPELDQQIGSARAEVASAQANAQLAKTTAARWADLLTDNSVSRQEADEKNGDFAVKRASVQAAQANLGRLLALKTFATLRAPFAGTVTQRSVEIGDLVGPGATTQQPLFAVADIRRIRIYVDVPQRFSAGLARQMTATLTVPDYPGRSFPARLTGNSGAIDSRSGALQVQLVADNAGGALKPGGYAQVRFDLHGEGQAAQVPSSALVFRAPGTEVATVTAGGHVHMLPVRLGRDLGQTVEIVSGVAAGQRIVDNPPDSIAEGELVRLAPANHG